MKNVLLFASMFVVGCGSPEQQAAVVAALGATPTPVAETPVMMSRTMAAPAAIEPAKLYSLRVVGRDELPACTVENEAQLAYASADKLFYVCQAESWLAIDITGQAGKDGQSIVGPQGVAGRDGIDGQSIVGPQGIQGIAGQSIVGATGASGLDGLSAGIRTTAEAAGSNCTTGGQKVQAFKDDNKNGTYDAGEVLLGTASYVCNGQVGATGATGTALIGTSAVAYDEPAGVNCPTGGQQIVTYKDLNQNGSEGAGERLYVRYVCNGLQGVNDRLVSKTVCTVIPGTPQFYLKGTSASLTNNTLSLPTLYKTSITARSLKYDNGIADISLRVSDTTTSEILFSGNYTTAPGEDVAVDFENYSIGFSDTAFVAEYVTTGRTTMSGWAANINAVGWYQSFLLPGNCTTTNY